ncbi:MAG TPA: NAD-dependent epimerase/dehydratase family protein, partial [Candidatus Wallbacteria bacterium]|nr:NAD-dependent epimerase/dehydratase family protein [Candidatus Wallbacteria bacterium]
MKILVTGGAGFIGSHVVDRFISLGHEVHIFDNLSTGKEENINKAAKFYKVDITGDEAREIIAKEKYDVIDHHAAQISVVNSVANPLNDAKINILGTLNIIQAAVSAGVKKMVFISSGGAVYGEKQSFPIGETELPMPQSPYAISKLAGEHYLRVLCQSAGIEYVVLRYSNVFGPRQDPHGEAGVVAIFSKLMISGKIPNIYGDGSAVRDYIYVKDVAEVNAIALEKVKNLEVNVSTAVGTSVNRLFAMMAEIIGFDRLDQVASALG